MPPSRETVKLSSPPCVTDYGEAFSLQLPLHSNRPAGAENIRAKGPATEASRTDS
jgi:hypothetical protein